MATVNYTIDVSAWTGWAQQAAERARNLEPANEAIGELLLAEIREAIDKSGLTETWKPLAPSTLTAERLRYGTTPLLKTRDLYNGLMKVATAAYVDVGSALRKSWTLFLGSKDGRVPARNPFAWRDGVMDRIGAMYTKFIVLGGI